MPMFQVVQVRIIYVVLFLTHSGMIAEIIIIDKSLFFLIVVSLLHYSSRKFSWQQCLYPWKQLENKMSSDAWRPQSKRCYAKNFDTNIFCSSMWQKFLSNSRDRKQLSSMYM